MKAAKTAEKGIKIAGNKIGEVAGEIVEVIKVRREVLLQVLLLQAAQHQISL